MLEIVRNYQGLLKNISFFIENSKFKKEYLISELGISRATFYNKVNKGNFTINEMIILSKLLFPEEAKAFEIKEALKQSRKDSNTGKTKSHLEVMETVRKRLQK